MGAELDRLEVQVEAQVTKANNQLDKLVGKLDRVSSAINSLIIYEGAILWQTLFEEDLKELI